MTGSKEDYFALLGPLRDLGWSVTAVDLPGMAESEGGDDPELYVLDALAGDVLDLARWVGGGQPIHLVGHSVGGLISREAVLTDPELFTSLTLYASGPGKVGDEAAASAVMLTSALYSLGTSQVYDLKLALNAELGLEPPDAGIAQFMRQRWVDTSPGHFLGMAAIALAETDRVADLAELDDTPLLVLFGTLDQTWPQTQLRGYGPAIGAETVLIEGAGHSPAVESPAQMVSALDSFWHRVDETQSMQTE